MRLFTFEIWRKNKSMQKDKFFAPKIFKIFDIEVLLN